MLRKASKILLKSLILSLSISLTLFLWGCTTTQTITKSEAIPYKSTKIEDPSMPAGMIRVKQAGIAGLRQVVYKERYSGDRLLSRDKISDKIVARPVEEIIQVGTAQPLIFTIKGRNGDFEITLTSFGRKSETITANKKVSGDFLLLKGTIKNTGPKPARSGNFLDMAAIHPAIKGGLNFLTAAAPPQLSPGQSADAQWQGSINPGGNGTNAGIASPTDIQVIPRAFVLAKNKLAAPSKPLTGLIEE